MGFGERIRRPPKVEKQPHAPHLPCPNRFAHATNDSKSGGEARDG
jgi:hypothetical protein